MSIDKDDIVELISDGARAVKKVAKETGDSVKTRYQLFKLGAELEDLYVELGQLANREFTKPGTVGVAKLMSLNDRINAKKIEIAIEKKNIK